MNNTYTEPPSMVPGNTFSIKDIYGRNVENLTLPKGFVAESFRPPQEKELYFSTIEAHRNTSQIATASFDFDTPRIILGPEPKPKTVRVVRVLEYVGPEKWIEDTMKKNAVGPNGRGMIGGSYTSPGFDTGIRELSIFKEEVK